MRPHRVDPDRDVFASFADVSQPQDARLIPIQVNLDLASSFDAARFALPLRNRAEFIGRVEPERDVFDRTFGWMPELLRRLLFHGIYSDIVFLRPDPPRGGLCSGMARWAIARWQGDEPAPASTEQAIERIRLFHGRQMKDLALLSALPWFLRGSSRAAYRAVRGDFIRHGATDRALDLAVPKMWRRDVLRAVVGEGHTVVPYRLRQHGPARGELEVYDPNHPSAIGSDTPRVIHFDLAHDRYSYGSTVTEDETDVGMIAVSQRAYEGPGTAVLALLGSLLLHPLKSPRALLGKVAAARPAAQSPAAPGIVSPAG
jgi:hypothetical protein